MHVRKENSPMLDDTLDLLRRAPMFEAVADIDLETIAERLITLEFEAGDLLFREGAPGHYICFLTTGRLNVWKDTAGAEPVVIAEIEPGRSVGEMSIIDGLTCSATVTAQTSSSVLALTREDFECLLKDNPGLGAEIYKGISKLLSMSLRRTTRDLVAERAKNQLNH